MRLSKHLVLLAVGAALVAAGVAVASQDSQRERPQTSDVSAAFTANQSSARTRTCTRVGDTYRVTHATWRGTSTSAEPRLAGPVVLRTRTVLNVTTGDGWLSGSWRSRNPVGGRASAHLSAVIEDGNHLDGLATGAVYGRYSRLLGNWSATIAGEVLSGELGANAPVAPDNSALLFRGGDCPGRR